MCKEEAVLRKTELDAVRFSERQYRDAEMGSAHAEKVSNDRYVALERDTDVVVKETQAQIRNLMFDHQSIVHHLQMKVESRDEEVLTKDAIYKDHSGVLAQEVRIRDGKIMDIEKDVQILQTTIEKSVPDEAYEDNAEDNDVGAVRGADAEKTSSSSRVRSGTPPRIPEVKTSPDKGTRTRSRSPPREEKHIASKGMSTSEKAILQKLDSQEVLIENQSEQLGNIKKFNKETVKKIEELCYDVHQRLASLEEAWWNNPDEGDSFKKEGASLPNAAEIVSKAEEGINIATVKLVEPTPKPVSKPAVLPTIKMNDDEEEAPMQNLLPYEEDDTRVYSDSDIELDPGPGSKSTKSETIVLVKTTLAKP